MWDKTIWVLDFLKGWGGLTLGTIYTIVLGFKRLIKAVDEIYFRFWDFPVFKLINTPRARASKQLIRTEIGVSSANTPPTLVAYNPKEIAARLGRSEKSVLATLNRLERTGKAEEVWPDGWFSKETAPPISERFLR
jgi:hypothetical protein